MSSDAPNNQLVDGAAPILGMRHLEAVLHCSRREVIEIAQSAKDHYHVFEIPKRDGHSRTICNPRGRLRRLQGRIKTALLDPVVFPQGMMGGIRGRTTKMNALLHVNCPVVVTMDLRDCFPSTTNRKIYDVFTRRLGCTPKIARLLTQLTTVSGCVPQGAPTSTALVNLALLDVYQRLEHLALGLDLNFSIWVDDITFSGKNARAVIAPAVLAIRRSGYSVHAGKKKVMSRRVPQEATGILLNTGAPTISRAKRDAIQRRIFDLSRRHAVAHSELGSLRGQISHVRWVCPGQAHYLEKLMDRLLSDLAIAS